MHEENIVSRVCDLGGFAGRAEALRAIRATLTALGERLRDDERAALGRALPSSLALVLDRCAYDGDFDADALFVRVARHENVGRGFAEEHAEIVCQALAEAFTEETLTRLRKQLGPAIAPLLGAPEPIASLPRMPSASGSTLATGRGGSRHPLSEAHPTDAHAESIARSLDPHAATRMSSARGLTEEQRGETLATGHPRAEHPSARGGDD